MTSRVPFLVLRAPLGRYTQKSNRLHLSRGPQAKWNAEPVSLAGSFVCASSPGERARARSTEPVSSVTSPRSAGGCRDACLWIRTVWVVALPDCSSAHGDCLPKDLRRLVLRPLVFGRASSAGGFLGGGTGGQFRRRNRGLCLCCASGGTLALAGRGAKCLFRRRPCVKPAPRASLCVSRRQSSQGVRSAM